MSLNKIIKKNALPKCSSCKKSLAMHFTNKCKLCEKKSDCLLVSYVIFVAIIAIITSIVFPILAYFQLL